MEFVPLVSSEALVRSIGGLWVFVLVGAFLLVDIILILSQVGE